MNPRLNYIADLLETAEPLPPASRCWLREALRSIATGADPAAALGLSPAHGRAERDELIRQRVTELPATTTSARARFLSEQARRIHRGRRSAYAWIEQADRLHTLPESVRQWHNILQ